LRNFIYLVRALVDDNEYAKTKKLVEQFTKGIGRELHEQLKAKIEKQQERNWVKSSKSKRSNEFFIFSVSTMVG
jgi:hypothetical protein